MAISILIQGISDWGKFCRMSEKSSDSNSCWEGAMKFSSDVIIARYFGGKDLATQGVMLIGGKPVLCTLELPYRQNLREESCIPCGEYRYEMVVSGRHGVTYEIQGVSNRDGILFHVGNDVGDTRGCILVGTRVSEDGKLVDSREGMHRFVELMAGRSEGIVLVTGVVG